ncbi:MAG: hypothetical protein HKN04_00950 [Rhodothermaceae bacterium]|nr:hypothetical protein [Rhodothermaceae bacterium]
MRLTLALIAVCGLGLVGCDSNETDTPRTFLITIENPASAPDANGAPNVLSPGAWAVHTSAIEFFTEGAAAGAGIEGIAEDGDPTAMVAALAGVSDVLSSGAFDTPVGATDPGPITPGGAYSFTVTASPGDRLSLATMYVQSNDLFLAFDPEGIALFNGSDPVSGDLSARMALWDAGTEVNEEPGTGPNQAPRQAGPNTGTDENGVIQDIGSVNDGYTYPAPIQAVRITIDPQ